MGGLAALHQNQSNEVPLLELQATQQDRELASEIFEKFSKKEGSQYIATKGALTWLYACLRTYRPKNILELGPGIGTITEVLLNHFTNIEKVVATEDNQYCLKVLPHNLTLGNDPRLIIVTKPTELDALNFSADMIIGDGGFYSEEEFKCAKEGTIVFCEGIRTKLREGFSKSLATRHLKIEFTHFGGMPLRLRIRKKFGIPVPRLYRDQKRGCWIGIVTSWSN